VRSAHASNTRFPIGKKTYRLAAAGIIYGVGVGQLWWPDESVVEIILSISGGDYLSQIQRLPV